MVGSSPRALLVYSATAIGAGLAGCSLFTPLDGYASKEIVFADGGQDAVANIDGNVNDSASTLDAGDGAADTGAPAGVNIHTYGSFDDGGCTGWGGFDATQNVSTTAYSGSHSCEFCGVKPGFYSGDDNGFLPNPQAGTYRAEAWVRSGETDDGPNEIRLTLRTFDNNPTFENRDMSTEGDITLTPLKWTHLQATLEVVQKAQFLNVYASSETGDSCFLLDDVRVERVK